MTSNLSLICFKCIYALIGIMLLIIEIISERITFDTSI